MRNIKTVRSLNHAKFELYYHAVFVTKFRYECINLEILDRLKEILGETLLKWKCQLIEFGGETDHVHLLFDAHPAMEMSVLMNNLKTVSSRLIRKEFSTHLDPYYWKPFFWSSGYGLKTAGGTATLEKLIEYVRNQEKPDPDTFCPPLTRD